MLLSAWTEYDGTSLFGGSVIYTKRQAESISTRQYELDHETCVLEQE